ncbi:hypothetical protein SERLA73DRAFT_176416 [Serpula lacrymans var. lacrymans S7.3]|uniref:Uncharacterized protein n=2 Tax=Serpula lacrymans var. lacrymans TaxID=341189 RepID=F8PMV7_SERL3|nr:uncharacterized protein SERLADRAFT_459276 [Serpula lacrymans var. lacrymans S7.9]EGO02939.1 hypothetical protein SERLA73DRAFT_176416 [Serpula lacrymans var. lacrymans S7.3]EGO28628.1 hypothetical protein SERLADRAFT_459276 [Serpula lacrymans var. lacrymans S7.9]
MYVNSKNDYGFTPLSSAVNKGHVEIVKLVLARDGVDVNSEDNCGRTPLSSAVYKGHMEIIKLLLAIDDVDVNSQDQEGWTPLSRAVHREKAEVVELLLARRDVHVNWKNKQGETLLFIADIYSPDMTSTRTCQMTTETRRFNVHYVWVMRVMREWPPYLLHGIVLQSLNLAPQNPSLRNRFNKLLCNL